MRSDVTQFALQAPHSLDAVLATLAETPGRHTLLAGGTELMVALGSGRLQQNSFLSIQHLRELRFIRPAERTIHIGAGTTFTDIRHSPELSRELPLLARAASWIGSIANQNRATIGGNLCNASPAADSSPALLVYEATVTLISTAGERTIPYTEFHLGYKKTALRPDELLYSVNIPRPCGDYRQYIRKVGTRNAQAISKTAVAAVALMNGTRISTVRVAAASLADKPVRCQATEAAISGKTLSEATIGEARAALAAEAKPIDDIRSTAKYRSTVACNLIEEFLRSLIV